MKRTIAIFTGTRAEYGILSHTIRALLQRADTEMLLIVSGSHLSEAHGMTVRQIEADGIPIAAMVDMRLPADDNRLALVDSARRCLEGVTEVLERLKPDIFVVLGDRYEAFHAAWAAHICGIPIAHICGGDTTLGANDEWFRYGITLLATFHFPSSDRAADKIRRQLMCGGLARNMSIGDILTIRSLAECVPQ